MTTVLITQEAAAEKLRVRPKTLTRWRWAGKGPAYRKVGRKVFYVADDLEEYLAQSRRRSTSDPGPTRTDAGRSRSDEAPSRA